MTNRYKIPEGLSAYKELPLYIVVAVWGYMNNRILTTKDVAREFCLSQQQTTDVINYIHREGSKHIRSQKMNLFCTVNGVKTKIRALKIKKIMVLSSPEELGRLRQKSLVRSRPQPRPMKKNSPSPECRENLKIIRQWVCCRRMGEDCSSIKKYLTGF